MKGNAMKCKIEFNMDNAAFNDCNAGAEVARILANLASKYEDYASLTGVENAIMDVNGNKIGCAKFIGKPPIKEGL